MGGRVRGERGGVLEPAAACWHQRSTSAFLNETLTKSPRRQPSACASSPSRQRARTADIPSLIPLISVLGETSSLDTLEHDRSWTTARVDARAQQQRLPLTGDGSNTAGCTPILPCIVYLQRESCPLPRSPTHGPGGWGVTGRLLRVSVG